MLVCIKVLVSYHCMINVSQYQSPRELGFFRILYTLLIPFGKFVFVTQRNCVATEQRH